jgi:adenylate cyclase
VYPTTASMQPNTPLSDVQLYGTRQERFIREFVTNSGLYWIVDLFRVISTEGLAAYLGEVSHWALFLACLIQAYVMSRKRIRTVWAANFIAPTLYALSDLAREGSVYFSEPNHWLYWCYATFMALLYAVRPHWPTFSALGEGVARTLLLPGAYMVTEWKTVTRSTLIDYWLHDPAHLFILSSSVTFGLLLGIATHLSNRFERALVMLARYLGQVSTWVFDPGIVQKSYRDSSILSLQRVQRTILFMDIRGFTPWSEEHDADKVVDMLNAYYSLAEAIVTAHGGFKIQIAGDGVMTRFSAPDQAVRTAWALQQAVSPLLGKHELGVGIGIHTGEVIEGMIGSEHTRQYGIIGDPVNTAARLQSMAKRGEIVLSAATYELLNEKPTHAKAQLATVKGKAAPLCVYVLTSEPHAETIPLET